MEPEFDKNAATALRLMGYKVRNFGGTMQVETYEVEEPKAEPQVEAEAIELIEKLGLKGQKSLVVDTGTEMRLPYREMSKTEKAVFEAIFPEATKVEEYAAGVIPVRVLQVLAHGRELFAEVTVRYGEAGSEAMLFGSDGKYGGKRYALARWGNNLQPFEKLREAARKIVKAEFETKLKECVGKCNAMIENVDGLTAKHLAGEQVSIPTVY